MKTLKMLKTNLVTVLSDTNFLQFLEFIKTLKLCFHTPNLSAIEKIFITNFRHSNSYCV